MNAILPVDMISMMADIVGTDATEERRMLSAYLDIAAAKILNRRYPLGVPDGAEVEPRYQMAQLEIAVYLYNKRGAEGESLHSENGISRSYGGQTDVPPDLLMQITPAGRVY